MRKRQKKRQKKREDAIDFGSFRIRCTDHKGNTGATEIGGSTYPGTEKWDYPCTF